MTSPDDTRRPGADLPPSYAPWDMPTHRELVEPLLGRAEPILRTELITAPPELRSNQHRALRKLVGKGYLVETEVPTAGKRRRKQIALAETEAPRLEAALERVRHEPQPAQPPTPTSVAGLTLVRATVAPDLVRAFGEALERQTNRPGVLGGLRAADTARGYEYLLVAGPDRGRRPADLVAALQAAGAECTRFPVWPGMDTAALRAHARDLQA